jgi:hypothetical protein
VRTWKGITAEEGGGTCTASKQKSECHLNTCFLHQRHIIANQHVTGGSSWVRTKDE